MELPFELIVCVVRFLPDIKKIEFVGMSKKIYNDCPLTLHRNYFAVGYGKKFNDSVVKMKCRYMDGPITFKNLEKLHIHSLVITKTTAFPDKLKVLKIGIVSHTEERYITLPKSVRKFKLLAICCGYFPFILNEGLQKFISSVHLKEIPDSVVYYNSDDLRNDLPGDKKICGKLCSYISPLLLSYNVVKLTLHCFCPDFIEVPVTVRKFNLRDVVNTEKKSIKFHEGITHINLSCKSLGSLSFPKSVKTLKLRLANTSGELIAPNVKRLDIFVSSWEGVRTVYLPNAERILFHVENYVVPVFPKGVKKIHWSSVAGRVQIPNSVESLTLNCWYNFEICDLNTLKNLRHLCFMNRIPDNLRIPNWVKKLSFYNEVLRKIPDFIVSVHVYSNDSSLPNIPKNLKKIFTGTLDINKYMDNLKTDKKIFVCYLDPKDYNNQKYLFKN